MSTRGASFCLGHMPTWVALLPVIAACLPGAPLNLYHADQGRCLQSVSWAVRGLEVSLPKRAIIAGSRPQPWACRGRPAEVVLILRGGGQDTCSWPLLIHSLWVLVGGRWPGYPSFPGGREWGPHAPGIIRRV